MKKKKFNVKNLLRRDILDLEQYTAGKGIKEISDKYKISPKKIIKLGSNENVLGPSPKAILAAFNESDNVNIYPEVTSDSLSKKIKTLNKLKNVEVFIGNGMDGIFEMLARLFLDKGDETIISIPTFSCYQLVTMWAGAKPKFVPLKSDHSLDVKKILKAINKKTKIIFICSPNNPTGNCMKEEDIEEIIKSTDKIVFLDEAYIEFADKSHVKWIEKYPNLIIGRTFSKIYGLAGLRVGYTFMHKSLANYYLNSITPFVVSRIGQVAAYSALDDTPFIRKSIRFVKEGKEFYYKELEKAGIEYIKSDANFISIKTKTKASKYAEKLQKKGIIVRDCARFGKGGENLLRITIGTRKQNEKVLKELVQIHNSKKRS